MTYTTEQLLALPDKEKRLLAKKLRSSLGENNTPVKENQQLMQALNKRWEDIESGKIKLYSKKEFWESIHKKLDK